MTHASFETSAPVVRTGGLLGRLRLAAQLRRERRALALLDPHLLSDIGLSRGEAAAEAARPVWDVPVTWLR